MRHAGLLRKYHFWPYAYAEIASRYEVEDPFMAWSDVSQAWDRAKTAWYGMFRAFFLDTSEERGPRNDWILPGDVYPSLPRVDPYIVLDVQPAFGWPQFQEQIEDQLSSVEEWVAKPSGLAVEVIVLKPPQKIRSSREETGQKVFDYQQLTYRLSADFIAQIGDVNTWSMIMQACMYRRFDANVPVVPSLGEPWIDFANDTYQGAVREYITSLVNLFILHMEYVEVHQQETDLTNAGKGAFGGTAGPEEGSPGGDGGDGDFAGSPDGDNPSLSGSLA